MDYYILKKDDEFKAIPADKEVCRSYEESGYRYVDKIAACTEQAAIDKLKAKNLATLKWPLIRLTGVAVALAAIWWLSK
jgi:hypothetical protein